jgi:hypothetical protein
LLLFTVISFLLVIKNKNGAWNGLMSCCFSISSDGPRRGRREERLLRRGDHSMDDGALLHVRVHVRILLLMFVGFQDVFYIGDSPDGIHLGIVGKQNQNQFRT